MKQLLILLLLPIITQAQTMEKSYVDYLRDTTQLYLTYNDFTIMAPDTSTSYARRDSSGNWEFYGDQSKVMEYIYQTYLKQKLFPIGDGSIQTGSITGYMYPDTIPSLGLVSIPGTWTWVDTIQTNDTIPSILLVCDTSINNGRIFWMRGYKVIVRNGFIWKNEYYLNERKQPLPKSIIVWMAQPAKL